MHNKSHPNPIRIIITIFYILAGVSFVFAQGASPIRGTCGGSAKAIISSRESPSIETFHKILWRREPKLTELQKVAREHWLRARKFQGAGDLEMAESLYQEAVQIDPFFAVAYNDLGLVYETEGESYNAEECYLKALDIDPNLASAYSNLAILYENNRDIDQAAYYWRKRAELGPLDDPWAKKARLRLQDIKMSVSSRPFEDAREDKMLAMMGDVQVEKAKLKTYDKALAKEYFRKAKIYYKKGDCLEAYKKALDAQQLDPSNEKIENFINKVQIRLLSK